MLSFFYARPKRFIFIQVYRRLEHISIVYHEAWFWYIIKLSCHYVAPITGLLAFEFDILIILFEKCKEEIRITDHLFHIILNSVSTLSSLNSL